MPAPHAGYLPVPSLLFCPILAARVRPAAVVLLGGAAGADPRGVRTDMRNCWGDAYALAYAAIRTCENAADRLCHRARFRRADPPRTSVSPPRRTPPVVAPARAPPGSAADYDQRPPVGCCPGPSLCRRSTSTSARAGEWVAHADQPACLIPAIRAASSPMRVGSPIPRSRLLSLALSGLSLTFHVPADVCLLLRVRD